MKKNTISDCLEVTDSIHLLKKKKQSIEYPSLKNNSLSVVLCKKKKKKGTSSVATQTISKCFPETQPDTPTALQGTHKVLHAYFFSSHNTFLKTYLTKLIVFTTLLMTFISEMGIFSATSDGSE